MTLSDQVTKFLYYDRKEDSELPVGAIEKAIKSGSISIEEMLSHFESELRKGLKE